MHFITDAKGKCAKSPRKGNEQSQYLKGIKFEMERRAEFSD